MTRLVPALGALILASGWVFAPGVEASRLGHDVVPTFQAESTPRMMGRVGAAVDDCLLLRTREGESVRAFPEDAAS